MPQLNGMAVHNELGSEQFIAAIYAETVTKDARELLLKDEDKAMEMRIITDNIYARRFNRKWIEGIAINSGSREIEQQAQNLADFGNFMRIKLKAGDILRIERNKTDGTLIFINSLKLGQIKDRKFFDLLLRTWLGPVPLSSDFKEGLLSEGNVPDALFQRFRAIHPAPERIELISAALNKETSTAKTTDQSSSTTSSRPTATHPIQTAALGTQKSDASAPPASSASTSQSKSISSVKSSSSSVTSIVLDENDLFDDENIFDEEDKNYSFTAEALLSEQLYISKITKWTGNYVKYPKIAVRNSQEGTVRLTVTLARNGKVIDIQFLEKSKFEQLNKAASRAVTRASPYPALPQEVKGDTYIFTVPVVFRLR